MRLRWPGHTPFVVLSGQAGLLVIGDGDFIDGSVCDFVGGMPDESV